MRCRTPRIRDADIDYTFAAIGVKDMTVDYTSNCANMTSAIGAFAVNSKLISLAGSEAVIRIHNTNTGKLIHAKCLMVGGEAFVE